MGKPGIYAWTVSAIVWLGGYYNSFSDTAGPRSDPVGIFAGNDWRNGSGILYRCCNGEIIPYEILGLYGYAVECTGIYLSAKLGVVGRIFSVFNKSYSSSGGTDDSGGAANTD